MQSVLVDSARDYQGMSIVEAQEHDRVLRVAIYFEAGLGIGALLVGWLIGFNPIDYFQLEPINLLYAAALTIPPVLFFITLTHLPLAPLKLIRERLDEIIVPLFGRLTILELGLVSLVAGWGEELLFRGLLQPALGSLMRGYEDIAGLVLSNIVFGLAHLVTPSYAVIAAVLGAFMGATFLYFDDLAVPIVIHALYDFAALVYYLRIARKPSASID